MSTYILIPARLNSTRLPNKPLLPIHGVPMVVWVANKAKQAVADGVATAFWVACDDPQIACVCAEAGIPFVMTQPHHPSGTDRLAEAARLLGLLDDDVVINLQGDEPLVPPVLLDQLNSLLLANLDCAMATLCEPIEADHASSPSVVKVAFAKQRALYFSRASIPYCRDELKAACGFRHLGLYAYRTKLLHQFSLWPVGELERLEQLEQLRVLENGQRIAIQVAAVTLPAGVDTKEDLERLNAMPIERLYGGW